MGGICGCAINNTLIQYCHVQDTIVTAIGDCAGGLVGEIIRGCLIHSYQLGVLSNPTVLIVSAANQTAGGLVGILEMAAVCECGIERGLVASKNNSGGVVGQISGLTNLTQVYATSLVTVQAYLLNIGGLIGSILCSQSPTSLTDSYSAANVIPAPNSGGLIGAVLAPVKFVDGLLSKLFHIFTSFLNLIKVYVVPNFSHINGTIMASCYGTTISYMNVFYLNDSSLPDIGSNSTCSLPYPSNCSNTVADLQNLVNQTFNKCVWDGYRLRSEYNYTATFASTFSQSFE